MIKERRIKKKRKKECDKVGFGVHEEGIEAKKEGYVFLLRELARKRQRDKSLIQDECYQG